MHDGQSTTHKSQAMHRDPPKVRRTPERLRGRARRATLTNLVTILLVQGNVDVVSPSSVCVCVCSVDMEQVGVARDEEFDQIF